MAAAGEDDEQAETAKRTMMMRTITARAVWRRPPLGSPASTASVLELVKTAARYGDASRLVSWCERLDGGTGRSGLIHELARGGHVEMLEMLLDGGIWQQHQLRSMMRAMMRGPGCGGDDVRTLMRRRDMQATLRGYDDRFAARCCSQGSDVSRGFNESRMAEWLAALLDGEYAGCVDVNGKYDGLSALQLCSNSGWLECVRVLVRTAGVDVNARSDFGNTALHYAARSGHAKVVRELIEVGDADGEVRDRFGDTPLAIAVPSRRYWMRAVQNLPS